MKLVHFADVDNTGLAISVICPSPGTSSATCRRARLSRRSACRLTQRKSPGYVGHSLFITQRIGVPTRNSRRVDSSSVLFTPMGKLQGIDSNTSGKRFGLDFRGWQTRFSIAGTPVLRAVICHELVLEHRTVSTTM